METKMEFPFVKLERLNPQLFENPKIKLEFLNIKYTAPTLPICKFEDANKKPDPKNMEERVNFKGSELVHHEVRISKGDQNGKQKYKRKCILEDDILPYKASKLQRKFLDRDEERDLRIIAALKRITRDIEYGFFENAVRELEVANLVELGFTFEDELCVLKDRLIQLQSIFAECEIAKSRNLHSDVLRLCNRGLCVSPGNLELQLLSADALYKLNQTEKARSIQFEVANTCFSRAMICFDANELDLVLDLLNQAIQLTKESKILKIKGFRRQIEKIKELEADVKALFRNAKKFYFEKKFEAAEMIFEECFLKMELLLLRMDKLAHSDS